MQRIFSTFPGGWPGCGLCLLRVAASAPLLLIGTSDSWGYPVEATFWIRISCCLSGALLLAGFWTPFAASLQALVEVVLACTGTFESSHVTHALIGISLVMLGPGSFSIDARLYGRKRLDLS